MSGNRFIALQLTKDEEEKLAFIQNVEFIVTEDTYEKVKEKADELSSETLFYTIIPENNENKLFFEIVSYILQNQNRMVPKTVLDDVIFKLQEVYDGINSIKSKIQENKES